MMIEKIVNKREIDDKTKTEAAGLKRSLQSFCQEQSIALAPQITAFIEERIKAEAVENNTLDFALAAQIFKQYAKDLSASLEKEYSDLYVCVLMQMLLQQDLPMEAWTEKFATTWKLFEQEGLVDPDHFAENVLAALHLAGKPDENQQPLVRRFGQIAAMRPDAVTNALLAGSYYGLEELKMRLPRLEETLSNPFGQGQQLAAISGTIMIADGGPAEGAKAIPMYLSLVRAGVSLQEKAVIRMLGILATLMQSPARQWKEIESISVQAADPTQRFLTQAMRWIFSSCRPEMYQDMDEIACKFLEGMYQELISNLTAAMLYL